MSRAVDLFERYTMRELAEMSQAIMDDPANENPAHANGTSILIYTRKAQRKLDDIAWAITYHLDAGGGMDIKGSER